MYQVETGAVPRAASRIRSELLLSAAHDLQQPLTAIKGHAQLLQRAARGDIALSTEAIAGCLAHIVSAADRMAGQLGELIDLSSSGLGGSDSLTRQAIDLVGLAREAVDEHQRTGATTAIALATTEATLVASVDPHRIRRLLDNVLGNALKYSPGGRAIFVGLSRDEAADGLFAVLRISDEGIGIPAADLPRVAERFYRGRNVKGIIAGSGVGLAGALQVVEEHGGTLAIESTEGVGTTVTVRLPLLPVPDGPSTGPARERRTA